jgi:hypothetical protein
MRILVVEDRELTATFLADLIRARLPGTYVDTAFTISEARRKLAVAGSMDSFDVVILDAKLPEERDRPLTFHSLGQDIRRRFPTTLIAYITAFEGEFQKEFGNTIQTDPFAIFQAKVGPWDNALIEGILRKRLDLGRQEVFGQEEGHPSEMYRFGIQSGGDLTSRLAALTLLVELFYRGRELAYWSEDFISEVEPILSRHFRVERNNDGTYFASFERGSNETQGTPPAMA